MINSKINIPNPCKANWNNMTTKDDGKYCNTCNVTVVDFTSMNIDQIKNYFENHREQKICGHYRATQVIINRPKHHQYLFDFYTKIEQKVNVPFFRTISLTLIVICMTVVGCDMGPTTGEKIPIDTNIQDSIRKATESQFVNDTVITNMDSMKK